MTVPSGSSPYALAEPAAVGVAAIEQELENLWRSAHAENESAILRAASFNLIYAVSAAAGGDADETAAALAVSNPSRVILLRLYDQPDKPMSAWVTAYCHKLSPTAQQVCSEFITLDAASHDREAVLSTIRALRLSGLPAALIWDSGLPSDHPLLLDLGRESDRLITAMIHPCAPAHALSGLFNLIDDLGTSVIVSELIEELASAWQNRVAILFDSSAANPASIQSVRIYHSADKIPAELLLVAAWIVAVLKWSGGHVTLRGHVPVIIFDGGNQLIFDADPKRDSPSIEFTFDNSSLVICKEPSADLRITELLRRQLRMWNRDSTREIVLATARRWIGELLFS